MMKFAKSCTGEGPISYAFASRRMMQENLEKTLLKVIQASDENDIADGWQVDLKSKQKLKKLVSNLKRGKTTMPKDGEKLPGSRGFGKKS